MAIEGKTRFGRVAGALVWGLAAPGAGMMLAPGVALGQATCATDWGTSTALGQGAFSCGPGAFASGNSPSNVGSTSVGILAGSGSDSGNVFNTAIGNSAGTNVSGDANTALGHRAGERVHGNSNTAYGAGAGSRVEGNNNIASGLTAGAMVVGDGNIASGAYAGYSVVGDQNVAIGSRAGNYLGTALYVSRTIALGANSVARFNDSIAVGAGVQTTRAHQVAIGGADHTYTLAGITGAASTAAQAGDIYFVSTDAAGNLAASTFSVQQVEDTVATVAGHTTQLANRSTQLADHDTRITTNTSNIAALDTTVSGHATQLATHTGELASLDGRVTTLEGSLGGLSGEIADARREARQGVAAAIAMASAPMPSAPGRTAWAMNVGHFHGATALGGSLSYRFDTAMPLGLNVGYAFAGQSHAARLGLSGEF